MINSLLRAVMQHHYYTIKGFYRDNKKQRIMIIRPKAPKTPLQDGLLLTELTWPVWQGISSSV